MPNARPAEYPRNTPEENPGGLVLGELAQRAGRRDEEIKSGGSSRSPWKLPERGTKRKISNENSKPYSKKETKPHWLQAFQIRVAREHIEWTGMIPRPISSCTEQSSIECACVLCANLPDAWLERQLPLRKCGSPSPDSRPRQPEGKVRAALGHYREVAGDVRGTSKAHEMDRGLSVVARPSWLEESASVAVRFRPALPRLDLNFPRRSAGALPSATGNKPTPLPPSALPRALDDGSPADVCIHPSLSMRNWRGPKQWAALMTLTTAPEMLSLKINERTTDARTLLVTSKQPLGPWLGRYLARAARIPRPRVLGAALPRPTEHSARPLSSSTGASPARVDVRIRRHVEPPTSRASSRAHAPLYPPSPAPAHVVPAIGFKLKPPAPRPHCPARLHTQQGPRCMCKEGDRGGGCGSSRDWKRALMLASGAEWSRGHKGAGARAGGSFEVGIPDVSLRARSLSSTHPLLPYVSYPARARRPQEHHEPSTALNYPRPPPRDLPRAHAAAPEARGRDGPARISDFPSTSARATRTCAMRTASLLHRFGVRPRAVLSALILLRRASPVELAPAHIVDFAHAPRSSSRTSSPRCARHPDAPAQEGPPRCSPACLLPLSWRTKTRVWFPRSGAARTTKQNDLAPGPRFHASSPFTPREADAVADLTLAEPLDAAFRPRYAPSGCLLAVVLREAHDVVDLALAEPLDAAFYSGASSPVISCEADDVDMAHASCSTPPSRAPPSALPPALIFAAASRARRRRARRPSPARLLAGGTAGGRGPRGYDTWRARVGGRRLGDPSSGALGAAAYGARRPARIQRAGDDAELVLEGLLQQLEGAVGRWRARMRTLRYFALLPEVALEGLLEPALDGVGSLGGGGGSAEVIRGLPAHRTRVVGVVIPVVEATGELCGAPFCATLGLCNTYSAGCLERRPRT
ncbi:hypothetical protein DFH09DRAFT_1505788 [Mycena vulgaris]|nr:hypothetical protein DFH09DRAFT_1505788 [Mycena vulgaris]